ncbi:glycerate kinase [Maritimibacter sp. 55A14]|uniref:glycerate kinase type-2 family protein n=1 Tax=Maritimibacter sp. 55A14 TaxID=2174844 RepID=UPI000D609B73|nr:DUF4147 domain-containing protein [Maritimibacter sp. 55A14]PWE32168.1 glycerate kinase [Maritimibacter sp. 55A14]
MAEPSAIARACFDAGLAAADPERAVAQALAEDPGIVRARGFLTYVAIGKAAVPMMRAAMAAKKPDKAFLVTNYENAATLEGCECHSAGHPTPDENGARAAKLLIRKLSTAWSGDRIVVLLSGGGSALLPAPVPGVPLEDKIALNDLLVHSGLAIGEINTVRRRLSLLKGGGLTWLADPAKVTALILSDVPGDDLSAIASGPMVQPGDAPDAAERLLRAHRLWDRAPESVRRALSGPPPDRRTDSAARNRIIGSNAVSLRAMAGAVPEGFAANLREAPLVGDVEAAAQEIAAAMRKAVGQGPAVLLFGGETTVRVRGEGLGGRNQELCLHVARALDREGPSSDWAFLSGGTDGRDGPTDAAGGLVTPDTLARIASSGLDLDVELAENNSNALLRAADALLVTGATGTNVADLQVAVLAG